MAIGIQDPLDVSPFIIICCCKAWENPAQTLDVLVRAQFCADEEDIGIFPVATGV
jgi:hypothetical protein